VHKHHERTVTIWTGPFDDPDAVLVPFNCGLRHSGRL
jgi:hypothetical protein